MEEKPGWTYKYIDCLGMHIAINDKTNILYTEDKTMYTPSENEILKKLNYQLPLAVHLIKKTFNGTLI